MRRTPFIPENTEGKHLPRRTCKHGNEGTPLCKECEAENAQKYKPAPQHPTVKTAQAIAERCRKRVVIIIHIDEEQIGYASYGDTKKECGVAKILGDECLALINNRIMITGERNKT